MQSQRWWWAVMSAAVGILQAIDAGVARAGLPVAILSSIGIALPTISIALRVPHAVRIAALGTGAMLLLIARLMSPVALNTLHVALFPAACFILFVWRLTRNGQTTA